jgi:hypothetical protein
LISANRSPASSKNSLPTIAEGAARSPLDQPIRAVQAARRDDRRDRSLLIAVDGPLYPVTIRAKNDAAINASCNRVPQSVIANATAGAMARERVPRPSIRAPGRHCRPRDPAIRRAGECFPSGLGTKF